MDLVGRARELAELGAPLGTVRRTGQGRAVLQREELLEDVETSAREMVDAGHAREEDVTTHRGRLVWRDATAASDPAGRRPRLLVQRVPGTKTVKNRVHLDLHVGPGRREAEVDRIVGLGGRRLHDGRLGPQTWVTLTDPGGNEPCVS